MEVKENKFPLSHLWLNGLPFLAALAGFILLNKDYLFISLQSVSALIILPFLIIPSESGKGRSMYLFLSVIFVLVYAWLKLQVFLFLSSGCLVVYFVEVAFGATGFLPLFFLMAASPAVYYVMGVFSFPVRLELSRFTCKAFALAGYMIENKGSYFVLPDGFSFHVDEACVGLKMVGTGLLAAILILAYRERQRQERFSFISVVLLISVTLFLLLFSNLFRIMALVLFRSMPGTVGHELIGLASLLVYTLIPFYFISAHIFRGMRLFDWRFPVIRSRWLNLVLLVLITVSGWKLKAGREQASNDELLERLEIRGYLKFPREDGVMAFKNDTFLIYIKPAIRPVEGGHPPQICWQASGFSLRDFSEVTVGSMSCMFGRLEKEGKFQYTAWWYDNGSVKTAREWEWRKASGLPFRVVNVNAKDSLYLLKWIEKYEAERINFFK